ncbi:hypothetical protein OIU77_018205 [Salix suchowensis]|uniref:DEK-C domain-containing protein n=1 Tax=Salix suchowensis TaxID=1278906 RepID=A0ABQ8ZS00_9ROSI|nr:hypothetical protein OIU77_018205 [Salix suchowensis]
MVTDQEIAKGVETVLRQSDPSTVTSLNGIVQQLEAKLGLDLSHKAAFICDQINLLLRSHPTTTASSSVTTTPHPPLTPQPPPPSQQAYQSPSQQAYQFQQGQALNLTPKRPFCPPISASTISPFPFCPAPSPPPSAASSAAAAGFSPGP